MSLAARWSSGMILAQSVEGLGFNSRMGPEDSSYSVNKVESILPFLFHILSIIYNKYKNILQSNRVHFNAQYLKYVRTYISK